MKTLAEQQVEHGWVRNLFRIVLTVACIALLGWIFSNSLRTGEESSAQSSTVIEIVQTVAGFIAPDSYIATATGEDYDFLHGIIRIIAHFSEFALLGVLTGWCYCAYTFKMRYTYLPIGCLFIVPMLDEYFQTFTPGRSAEIVDVLVDTSGAMVGFLLALLSVWIGILIYKKAKKSAKNKKDREKKSTCMQ